MSQCAATALGRMHDDARRCRCRCSEYAVAVAVGEGG